MAAELGNPYKITNTGTHSTAITILQAVAHATRPLVLVRAWVEESGSATAAMARIQLMRQTTAGTMSALSPGPLPIRPNEPTAGFTAQHTATAEPTAGDILMDEAFNVVNGWLFLPTPDEQIVIPAAGRLGMKFGAAPASQTWVYGMTLVEIG
jgi:hypothetical protein